MIWRLQFLSNKRCYDSCKHYVYNSWNLLWYSLHRFTLLSPKYICRLISDLDMSAYLRSDVRVRTISEWKIPEVSLKVGRSPRLPWRSWLEDVRGYPIGRKISDSDIVRFSNVEAAYLRSRWNCYICHIHNGHPFINCKGICKHLPNRQKVNFPERWMTFV